MTTLIKQLSGNDCVLACVAMARGVKYWHDLWATDDLEKVIKSGGIHTLDSWMDRAGFVKDVNWFEFQAYGSSDQQLIKCLLWKRPALLSVHSLNIKGGSHMVYWDGHEVFDPSTLRTHAFLHSMVITGVCLLHGYLPDWEPKGKSNADHHSV